MSTHAGPRRSVTINETIEGELRSIQGALIAKLKDDVSYTTVVNMVLLGGLLGSLKFDDSDWEDINGFLHDQKRQLDLDGTTDYLIGRLVEEMGMAR